MREAGLEPARPEWTLEPESSESANSTTRASVVFRLLGYITTDIPACQAESAEKVAKNQRQICFDLWLTYAARCFLADDRSPGEPSEAFMFWKEETGLEDKRLRAMRGDSFRRGCFRRVSGGPIFSLAREKIGAERALGRVWCILPGRQWASAPAKRIKTASEILCCFKFRGKRPEKPKRFFWSLSRGLRGEIEIFPARFLFVTFSFGEAKENVMPQPLRLPSRTGRCGRIRRTAHLSLPCTA